MNFVLVKYRTISNHNFWFGIALCILFITFSSNSYSQHSFDYQIKKAKKVSKDRIEQIAALQKILPSLEKTKYYDTLALVHYAIAFRYTKLGNSYSQFVLSHSRKSLDYLDKTDVESYIRNRCYKYQAEYHLKREHMDSVFYFNELIKNSLILDNRKSVSCYTIMHLKMSYKYFKDKRFDEAYNKIEKIIHSKYWDLQVPKDKVYFLQQKLRILQLTDISSTESNEEILNQIKELLVNHPKLYHAVFTSHSINKASIAYGKEEYEKGIQILEDVLSNPSNYETDRIKDFSYINLYTILSKLYLAKNDLINAKLYNDKAIDLIPKLDISKFDKIVHILNKVTLLDNMKQHEDALNSLDDISQEFWEDDQFVKSKLYVAHKEYLIQILQKKCEILKHIYNENSDTTLLHRIIYHTNQIDSLHNAFQQELYFNNAKYRSSARVLSNYKVGIEAAYELQNLEKLWYYFERSKGSNLLNILESNNHQSEDIIREIWQAKIDIELEKEFNLLTEDEIEKLDNQIVEYNNELVDLFEKNNHEIMLSNQVISTNHVVQNLKKSQGFASFSEGANHLYLILLYDNKKEFHRLQKLDSLDEYFTIYSENLKNKGDLKTFKEISNTLYNLIASKLSKKEINEWIISPSTQMSTIPFSCFVNDDGEYLVHKYAHSYVTSASIYTRLQNDNNFINNGVVICPNYEVKSKDSAQINTLKPLKHSLTEAQHTAEQIPNTKIIRKCSPEKFMEEYREKDFLHYTGHAILYENNPDLSYLALASNDNSKVTSLEISSLKSNAKLIGLSACNTKRGKIRPGEDIFGMSRAFIESGAKSVVSTLWEVNDRSSSEVFDHFYRKVLNENMDKNTALQQAQIEYLESTEDYLSHPYYWAGIILNGNTKSVTLLKSPVKYIYYGLGILIFVFLIQIITKRLIK